MANQVKFARNKTTQEALGSEDKNTIFFTTDESSIVMGGKVYGSTLEESKKEFLDKLYEDHIKSLFVISASSSKSTVNPGTEVTITVSVKNDGIFCSADTDLVGTGFLSGVVFEEQTPGVYKATVQISKVGVNSSTITAVYSEITKTVSIQVGCYNNIIYGWSELESLSSISDLRDASSIGPKASSAGEYQFSNSGVGYYYILIPDGTSVASSLANSVPQGTEGPIPVYFISQNLTGYSVFRIADSQAPSSHIIKFT